MSETRMVQINGKRIRIYPVKLKTEEIGGDVKKNLKRFSSHGYDIEIYRDEDVDGAPIWCWRASKEDFNWLSSGHESKVMARWDMAKHIYTWRLQGA